MTTQTQQARQEWMAVLARAPKETLESAWEALDEAPRYITLRQPECGMAMVRGQVGGEGDAFNLGEVTVTRCAVQLDDGPTGMSWVLGRDKRHAELAALFDALLQTRRHETLKGQLIEPCRKQWQETRERRAREAAATKVDFFTMVRGEDE